jgi:hypothetical protein
MRSLTGAPNAEPSPLAFVARLCDVQAPQASRRRPRREGPRCGEAAPRRQPPILAPHTRPRLNNAALCAEPNSPVSVMRREGSSKASPASGSPRRPGCQSGVYQIRDGRRWRLVIGHEGKSIYVGTFDSLDEADAAARAKRNELFTANYRDRVSAT